MVLTRLGRHGKLSGPEGVLGKDGEESGTAVSHGVEWAGNGEDEVHGVLERSADIAEGAHDRGQG